MLERWLRYLERNAMSTPTAQDLKRHAFLMEHGLGNFYKLPPDHVGYITGATMEKLVDLALTASQPAMGARSKYHGMTFDEEMTALGYPPRKLKGYGDCKCILSQYCDGTCNPIYEDAAPPAAQEETAPELESLETGEADAIEPRARRVTR